ncbi:TetR/AcrR family transcriptional regulator [Roseibium sp.]|uniref:TetR/AcrR family transcriptional regulator n=1 Tax=Roseibium sp. TaxID=1936156 RepID=UPI003265C926
MSQTAAGSAGRPLDLQVSDALREATLAVLSRNGYERTTVAAIAAHARTSKQAVYRRFQNKEELVAASVAHALLDATPGPPQRGSVAEDLRQCLAGMVGALQETSLGGALRALMPQREKTAIAAVLDEAEEGRRLLMRQIFIATPFEADMETRIDLLLGLVTFRLIVRGVRITDEDIATAIYLVLGLVAPRDPEGPQGLPGM